MKKNKLNNGYTYYKCETHEIVDNLNENGFCDSCNSLIFDGYLIPVLNSYYCENCFNEWSKDSKYYAEDIPYELLKIQHYEKLIPVG